jgi:DNA-binding NarL/FixJ family response regulator
VSGTPAHEIRVVVVDDHPMFRLGLAAAISDMDGITMVGQATCGAEVAELVEHVDPHVIILDMRLPDCSGLDLNRWLVEHHPTVGVLMLTMSEDLDSALTALGDGASGYLVKGADPDRVEHAIRTVATGDTVIDQSLVAQVIGPSRSSSRSTGRPFPQLTHREFEVLELIATGCNNGQIAHRLVVSPKTVRNHVSNVFAKLHVTDRAGAIVLAHRHDVGT